MNWNSLSSLLWLLATGALFYWMMKKGGCGGGHGAHGHAGHRHGDTGIPRSMGDASQGSHSGAIARDPVCGMDVIPDHAAGMRTVGGRAFYFCSAECVEKFDHDPEGYAHRSSALGPTEPDPLASHRPHSGR